MRFRQVKTVENLIGAGFTGNEAVILYCLYKFGLMTAREIFERTGIAKVSTLFILKKFFADGLVERMHRDNTFVFSARSPEVLSLRLEATRKTIARKQTLLNNALAELQAMQDYETDRKIQYYNDLEHIKRLRAGLVDTQTQGGLISWNSKNGVEYFENDEYVYLLSLKKQFAIKITPKENYLKLLDLCKSYS